MLKKIWGKGIFLVLLIMAVALLSPHKVMAQAVDNAGNRETATFGDQDAAKNYRISADTTGLIEFAQDTPIAWSYENIASGASINGKYTTTAGQGGGYFLSATDTGLNISDYGGWTAGVSAPGTLNGSGTRYILPTCNTAALGFAFDIATAVQETITITPYSTADSIAWSISNTGLPAGIGIKNSGSKQAGDEVQAQCTSVGNWTVRNWAGTWAPST